MPTDANSQQCWDLQCIVEKIQSLETMCKAHACMAPKMLEEFCKRIKNCWATLRRPRNKRYVESCWPTMLRPFTRERYVGNCYPTILLLFARVLTREHHSHTLRQKNGTNFAEKSGEFMTSYYKDVPSYSSQAAATLARYLEKMTKLRQKL